MIMSSSLKFEGNVEGVGNVYYVEAPFDEEMKLFKENGLALISAKDLAYARIKLGKDHSVSQNGSWIREGDLYVPRRLAGETSIVRLKKSLVIDEPEPAVEAHKKGNEARIDDDFAMSIFEKAKKGSEDYHVLESADAIPTDRFGENATAIFLFGKQQAKDYGLFLKDAKINVMRLYFHDIRHINSQGPYVSQLWFGWLGNYSNFIGNDRFLNCDFRARGVQLAAEDDRIEKTAVETYTSRQRSTALKAAGFPGLEEKLFETLRRK